VAHDIWALLAPIALALTTAALGWAGARSSRRALESDLDLRDKIPNHLHPDWDLVIERRIKAIATWSIVPRITRLGLGLAAAAFLAEVVLANRISSMSNDLRQFDTPSEAPQASELYRRIEDWSRYEKIVVWGIGTALVLATCGFVLHIVLGVVRRSEISKSLELTHQASTQSASSEGAEAIPD
jgi:hypothetical protein